MEVVAFSQQEEDLHALFRRHPGVFFPIRCLGFGKAMEDAYHVLQIPILALASAASCDTLKQNMASVIGDKLGPYEILALIGEGGMGEVYKARDTRLDRTVAIKRAHEHFNERFDKEARAVAALIIPTSASFTTWVRTTW